MSSMTQQHLTGDDLRMLKRVLDDFGILDLPEENSRLERLLAARLLIGIFQKGYVSEASLRFEMYHHLYEVFEERLNALEGVGLHLWESETSALVRARKRKPSIALGHLSAAETLLRRAKIDSASYILGTFALSRDEESLPYRSMFPPRSMKAA